MSEQDHLEREAEQRGYEKGVQAVDRAVAEIIEKRRACYLTTAELANLNDACIPLKSLGFGAFLVGSALTDPDYRDVDVRVIMPDGEFDKRFGDNREFWSITCRGIAAHLAKVTGLPIDFQIQRATEANEKFPDSGNRNPLGLAHSARPLAGGGDATRFGESAVIQELES